MDSRELVATIGPIITPDAARDAGVSVRTLSRWAAAGWLLRMGRGAYVHEETWRAASPWGRHLLHARALVAACPSRRLAGPTALAWHGIRVCSGVPQQIHLSRPGPTRVRGEVVHHAELEPQPLDGDGSEHPATSVACAIAHTALMNPVDAIIAGDEACARGLTTRAKLIAFAAGLGSHKRAAVQRVASGVDAASPGLAFSAVRAHLVVAGFGAEYEVVDGAPVVRLWLPHEPKCSVDVLVDAGPVHEIDTSAARPEFVVCDGDYHAMIREVAQRLARRVGAGL